MQNKLTLGILITTMNFGIERVKKELLPQLKNVDEVIISHQITDKNIKPETEKLGEKVKYFYMYDKGVSKNRNNAIKYLTSDIGLICDDDISYFDGFENIIKEEYLKNYSDLITFEFIDQFGDKSKNYKVNGRHSFLSLLNLAGYDISFRRNILGNINFDEDFGFSKYISGEDNIFLTDCYKNKLKICHCEKIIGIHPKGNSWDIWGLENISDKGSVLYRIFGPISFIINIYFSIIKYSEYKNKLGFFKFLYLIQKGSFNFMIGK